MTTRSPWLPRPNPKARLRLFCFPCAGAGSSIYRDWPSHLPKEVDLCPVRLPGREGRFSEPPIRRMPLMATAAARAILPHTNRPFALMGHSMGAVIAFECARELRKSGAAAPAHLFLCGHRAPQLPHPQPALHTQPDSALMEEMVRLQGTSDPMIEDEEFLQILLPVLRADYELIETHVHSPEVALACPISAFGGAEDNDLGREELEGWREHTAAGFSLTMLPGGHFFIHGARELLLSHIRRDLEGILKGLT